MSHHFDYTADERLDISDAYCFAGPRDAFGPRTVFGMNASPNDAGPWDPAGYYELKVDTNQDLVEDITWRFTFPVDSAGVQHVVVAELTGPASHRPQRPRQDHHAPQRARGRGPGGGARHQDLRRPAHRLVLQLPSLPHHAGQRPE